MIDASLVDHDARRHIAIPCSNGGVSRPIEVAVRPVVAEGAGPGAIDPATHGEGRVTPDENPGVGASLLRHEDVATVVAVERRSGGVTRSCGSKRECENGEYANDRRCQQFLNAFQVYLLTL